MDRTLVHRRLSNIAVSQSLLQTAGNCLAVIQLAAIRLRSGINEVHTLVELSGDLVMLLMEITFGLPYSALSTKSLSAPDSAPQISPLRPASCRTLWSGYLSGRDRRGSSR